MNNDLEYGHTDHPMRHYDQTCAACEIESLRRRLQDGSPVVEATIQHMALRITELESCIKSHGIPVKTMTGGVAHYCTKEEI